MSDWSKEIVKELGLAGQYGLSLKELFNRLNVIEKDVKFQEFFYINMRKLKLGIIFTGNQKDQVEELSFQALLNNSSYRFTVSETQREWAVMGSFFKSMSFSDAAFLIFSLIAQSKSHGITQVELSKASGQDPKTVFHHLKMLGNAKVIVKYPIIHDGNKTALCIHMDFADQNSGYLKHVQLRTTNVITQEDFSYVDSGINHADLVKVKISTLLENSKNQMLATDDMFDVIEEESGETFNRRLFNRILQQMQNLGYLEVVYVPLGDDKILRCAKLLKTFRLIKSKEYTGFERNSESSIKYALKRSTDMLLDQSLLAQGRFFCDLSIEWQIFRLIYLSGSQGVTSNMIYRSLRMEGNKMMERILERLLKGDASKGLSITKVLENVGREKRYRYFACKKADDHFRNDLQGSESTAKNKKSGNKSAIHLSNLQRRNNLLELLEAHKVLECGNSLIDAYEKLMQERGTQTGYRIDRRTLDRTAKSLQDDNLLSMHIIRIPQMAGSVMTKTLLLHKSVTMKDPIVHNLIDSIQSKAFQINGAAGKRILEHVDIERLISCKKKPRLMENPKKENQVMEDATIYRGEHDPTLIEFTFPDADLDEDTENTENQNSNSWIGCLSKYGYVPNVMARARILHAWLFQKLCHEVKNEDTARYENDGWFSLTMLTNDLEFNYYMQLVGITTDPQVLQGFLKEGSHKNVTTGTLPQHVRDVVFSKGYMRYRREIRNILQELEKHKLVTPGDNQIHGDQLWTKYKLNSEVALPVSETSSETYCIKNLDTLRTFWVKINSLQTKRLLSQRIRISRAKKKTTDRQSLKASNDQSNVDNDNLEASPSDNSIPEKSISVSEIMKSGRKKKVHPSVKSRLSLKKEPVNKLEDAHTMKAVVQNEHIKPRQRIQWTDDMVLKLMVYYTILSHESRPKTIFIWKSINSKFENFGENRCKKQIENAKKDPFLTSQLEWLKVKWQKLFAENFKDRTSYFDLDEFSEVLLSKIDVASWSKKGNIEDMQLLSESDLARSSLVERDVEKWIADKYTTTAKLAYLLKFPFTCHLYNPELDDFSNQDESEYELKKQIAKSTIKSILLTSESNYDPVIASKMLQCIDSSILNAAFGELSSSNILSKVKGKDRHGPGRGYQLSDRFITSLSAGFPVGMISHAKSFFQTLKTSSPIPYSLSIGRGEMACILNEIPKQTIKLTPLGSLENDDLLESLEYSFPISISYSGSMDLKRTTRDTDLNSSVSSESNEAQVSMKKQKTADDHDNSQINKGTELSECQRRLLSLIKKGGLFGCTRSHLRKSLETQARRTLESDLKFLEVSYIAKVGFNSIRYIDKIYIKEWQIRQDTFHYSPEIWNDISGSTVTIFLDTALENCVSIIHKNPGIYFSKLVQFLPLSTLEVLKLLEILENKGIITKILLLKPQISLFSSETVDDEISSYRLSRDWYKYF